MRVQSRTKIRFFTREVIAASKEASQVRLRRISRLIEKKVKQNISVPTAASGPSVPGEFPHRDSGELRDSVSSSVVGWSAFIGASAPHAKIVEMQRPYLRRTVAEERSAIRRAFR